MKVLNEKPPEWIMSGCLSQFRINVERTFWTYGDTIYNPGGIDIRDDIMAHEEQHEKQQAEIGKDEWWKKYLTEPRFRLEQEAEAYGVQYKYYCRRVKDRNQQDRFLRSIASQLSGPLYQLALSHQQACLMIEVLAGKKKLPVPTP